MLEIEGNMDCQERMVNRDNEVKKAMSERRVNKVKRARQD
jgi:hypothetical protein